MVFYNRASWSLFYLGIDAQRVEDFLPMHTDKFTPPAVIAAAPHPRFVTHRQLESEFGIAYGNVHLGRLEKAGRFPRRIRLSANAVAWSFAEIVEWVEQRIAQRGVAPTHRTSPASRHSSIAR